MVFSLNIPEDTLSDGAVHLAGGSGKWCCVKSRSEPQLAVEFEKYGGIYEERYSWS